MGSSGGNFWKAKPELEELPLIFWRFFENSCVTGTHVSVNLRKIDNFGSLLKSVESWLNGN